MVDEARGAGSADPTDDVPLADDPPLRGAGVLRPLPDAFRGRDGDRSLAASRPWSSLVVAAVMLLAGSIASLAVVGGDARWLVAAGEGIVRRGGLLDHVPYALASSSGWHNVPVLAQLIAYGSTQLTRHGLLALHVLAVVGGMLVLARDAHRGGASGGGASAALALMVLGGSITFLVVRLQLFSLLLFPVLAAVLRSDHIKPGRRVWWAPGVLALWGNLHGAVLLGLAATLTYLLFSRARLSWRTAAAVSIASCAALLLTPEGVRGTVDYYAAVAHNEAARRHVGLWARLSLGNPFDVALVACALVLAVSFARARPPLWECLTALGLAVAVGMAARNGVWLLMFLVPVAARALPTPKTGHRPVLAVSTTIVGLTLVAVALVRGPAALGASPRLVDLAVAASYQCAVYAQDVLGEQVVEAGGRVWITNPIDAFGPEDQRRYVGWMQSGDLDLAPASVGAFLVQPGGVPDDALRTSTRHAVAAQDDTAVLYVDHGACEPPPGDPRAAR